MAYKSKHALDPRVVAMLPDMYTATQLEYAKGVVSGEIKPTYFKASDIPEKKAAPEASRRSTRRLRPRQSKSQSIGQVDAFLLSSAMMIWFLL